MSLYCHLHPDTDAALALPALRLTIYNNYNNANKTRKYSTPVNEIEYPDKSTQIWKSTAAIVSVSKWHERDTLRQRWQSFDIIQTSSAFIRVIPILWRCDRFFRRSAPLWQDDKTQKTWFAKAKTRSPKRKRQKDGSPERPILGFADAFRSTEDRNRTLTVLALLYIEWGTCNHILKHRVWTTFQNIEWMDCT